MASLPEQRLQNNERLKVRALEVAISEVLSFLTKFEKSQKLMDAIRSKVKQEVETFPARNFGGGVVSMIDEERLWESINSWLPKEGK